MAGDVVGDRGFFQPGWHGRTKTGRLWCYAVDNRPWQGPGHPVAAYAYSEDRKAEHPASHLKGFRGLLQVDGYAGFGSLVKAATEGGVQLASHPRCPGGRRRRVH
jgi:transposase